MDITKSITKRNRARTPASRSGRGGALVATSVGVGEVEQAHQLYATEADRRIPLANPFPKLATVPPNMLSRAIDDVAIAIDPQKIRVVKILNALRYAMPWHRAVQFLREYAPEGERGRDVYAFYREFVGREDVSREAAVMRQFLADRILAQATLVANGFLSTRRGYGGVGQDVLAVTRPIRDKYAEFLGERAWLSGRTPRAFELASFADSRNPLAFPPARTVADQCAYDYEKISWSPLPVRRILLKADSEWGRQYGLGDQRVTDRATGVVWMAARPDWYVARCATGRDFVRDGVAYELMDGSVHVETVDDYQSFTQKVLSLQLVETRAINSASLNAARFTLAGNAIFARASFDADVVLKSFVDDVEEARTTTGQARALNRDLARFLSSVLVFFIPLIDREQSHVARALNGQYRSRDLASMSATLTLPEAFVPRDNDRVVVAVESLIAIKRRQIEQNFYASMMDGSNYVRVWSMTPVVAGIKLVGIADASLGACPRASSSDVVYYAAREGDDRRTYCFDRSNVVGVPTNPQTGLAFERWFVDDLAMIHDPVTPNASADYARDASAHAAAESISSAGVVEATDLAPGLYSRLRHELANLRPIYCASCNAEMFRSRFSTLHGHGRQSFCSRRCFGDVTTVGSGGS